MGMAAADDKFHVLAVDDSLIDRKLIERLLKISSFQGTFFFFFVWVMGFGFLEFIWLKNGYFFGFCLLHAVTTVDSGSKALEFLGWHEDERSNSNETSVSPMIHQVLFLYLYTWNLGLDVWKSHYWFQEVEVNLVITDYCMPGMTGYDLLKKMKVYILVFWGFFCIDRYLFWKIVLLSENSYSYSKFQHCFKNM